MSQRHGIRWHLLQTQLVSIVPIGVFAATMLYLHWQVQEHERERSQIESVRLLAAAVDNTLDSTIERLSIFARLWGSTSLSEKDIYEQAKLALAANEDWSNLFAFQADGHGVFRADEPFGADVPPIARLDVWRPIFAERRPVISNVLIAPQRGTPIVAVGVPVVHDGKVTHALIVGLDLRWYDRLLNQPGQPAGAVTALFDANFRFVARSVEGEERRGQAPTPQLVDDMKAVPEGINRYVNLNGTPVYTTWTFSQHGWGVGFGTPSAPVDDAFWNHLLLFGLLWAVAVGGGVLYAFAKARPIAASLESLERQAASFATGRRLAAMPDSRVREVDRAVTALETASELLQTATRERDESLEIERDARAAAEAANSAKDAFLAMLGHELRNPLAAIANAATILRTESRSAEQFELATSVVERQIQHLKRLIDDLLDVGRAMTNKIVLDREPLDAAACARRVVETLETAGRFAERRVELDLAPAWIEGDYTRLEQILNNLLGNAVRHTARGGRIDLRVAREGGETVIQVADDGGGITAEDLPHIFDLFFQAESTPDRAAGGLGIGLTLVERLARLHGGSAAAASAGPGHGATFTVRLPAIAAAEPLQQTSETTHEPRSQRILVVEDNTDARASLCIALALQGHEVIEAADGLEGLELLRREQPRVAVLDIGLPGLDGYEIARRARVELGDRILLIAVTGYGTARDAEQAAAAGFDEHLTKPVSVDALIAAIERLRRAARS